MLDVSRYRESERITMKVKNPVILKDALYNLNPTSGANGDYCKGMVVGVVAALMAMGFTFKDALRQVAENFPMYGKRIDRKSVIPEAWYNELGEMLLTIERTNTK
jgi:hypothetical protein